MKRVLVLPVLVLGVACRNDFRTPDRPPDQPAQASVVTTAGAFGEGGSIIVHWSGADDATRGYAVYASGDPEDPGLPRTCAGVSGSSGGAVLPPCRIDGLVEGQLYYVRVAALSEEFDPTQPDASEDELKELDGLQDLSIRAGYSGNARGPFAWAGLPKATADGHGGFGVELVGAWFDDPVPGDPEHACFTYWEGDSDRELDPCTNEILLDPSLAGALSATCSGDEEVCHVIFEVEAGDGRVGQAYTRAVLP